MATLYVRHFNLKDSLSDEEVLEYWKFSMEEAIPAIQKVPGVRSVKAYSGAGGLRADLRYAIEMDEPVSTNACWPTERAVSDDEA